MIKIKEEKGISLISLVIAITVLVILTNVIIYNMRSNLKVENLKLLQNDIDNLRNKISSYYAQNDKLPAKLIYTNIEHIEETGVINNVVDTGNFLVIDLSAIENLTLNYGKDYEKIKDKDDWANEEEETNYTDLYIINETSHNIFYVKGITLDSEVYYTDYTSEDLDTKAVDLRYIEGIKIPEGFYYVEGIKDTGIIIKDNNNNRYKWIEIENDIPDDIEIEEEEKEVFFESINIYKGCYKSENSNQVIYLEPERWSPIYDINGKYVDQNGDSAIIPAGFQVSQIPGENSVYEGLVIQDGEGNQFVWIPVTSEEKYTRNTKYEKSHVSETAIDDTDYLPDGITDEKQSVLAAGGFYIGRYEAGDLSATDFRDGATEGVLICQKNKYPYTYITQEDAKQKAKTFINNDYVKSALMSGTQWDITMETINGRLDGNGEIFDVRKVSDEEPSDRHLGERKTTGFNIADKVYNIYDLEGNLREYVAEKNTYDYGDDNISYVGRGGGYADTNTCSLRYALKGLAQNGLSFRVVLYVIAQ